jgi:hypothetical protein
MKNINSKHLTEIADIEIINDGDIIKTIVNFEFYDKLEYSKARIIEHKSKFYRKIEMIVNSKSHKDILYIMKVCHQNNECKKLFSRTMTYWINVWGVCRYKKFKNQ